MALDKGKTMTPTEKADKVVKILGLVGGNVRHAFKLQAYFCRAAYKDDVKKHFDQSKAASGYNQILDSLYFELIMTLVRLFDNLKEEKGAHNTASIPGLMSLLSETEVVAELQVRSEQRKNSTGDLDTDFLKKLEADAVQSASKDASKETSLIFALFRDFEKLKGSHLLSRLRTIRNELLAHTAIKRNRNNPAHYGDTEKLLKKTAQFVVSLNSSVKSLHDDYKGEIEIWQEHADYFWKKVIEGNGEKPTNHST